MNILKTDFVESMIDNYLVRAIFILVIRKEEFRVCKSRLHLILQLQTLFIEFTGAVCWHVVA